MKNNKQKFQVIVIGGGLAGFCAAIAAARQGIKTCIIQNRPVFGGNSSSEVRVTPHGACAFHAYARETGIISELLIEERANNHEEIFENGWTNSVWDLTMYNMAQSTPNLTIHVNTDVYQVKKKDKRSIESIRARTQNTEIELTLEGDIFIDASGDGIVGDLAGCEWRIGSESKSEFNEPHAPLEASKDVMGSSIHFKTKDIGKPAPFHAPEWAMHYEDAGFFYNQGRLPKEERGGYWWLEIGVPYDTISQNEEIRHELTRHALGVWDWMKNKDPKMKELTKNYALDWIGQVPGKRESRRIMGQYLMTENDPQNCTIFPDEIAFGGWFIDLHTPGGLLAANSEPASNESYSTFSEYAVKSYAGPYGIPLRSLIAKDIDNLMMAGRNISVTHAALGTVRVMNTTALMGQAAGTAAAVALKMDIRISEVPHKAIVEVQQQLLRDGCFLPNYQNMDSRDLARNAAVTASSEANSYGAGPESKGSNLGLAIWRDQPQYTVQRLENKHGQIIAIGNDKLDKIEIYLNNDSGQDQQIQVELRECTHLWDYRSEPPLITKAELVVRPGQHWVSWNIKLNNAPSGKWVRLDILQNAKVSWLTAGRIETGHMAMYQISKERMRRFGNGETLSFRLSPPQPVYSAAQVINGVTRPHRFTNVWKSDPCLPLSQWIQLDWETPQQISQVELTFPGHLFREYHAYGPFYKDPQCPKDYSIEAQINGDWKILTTITGNFQRHRKHSLEFEINTTSLRITIHATNGDASAQIYEIRCYH